MAKHDVEACRETPSCGSPVIDRRKHRDWHRLVVGGYDPTPPPDDRPRFVGVDDVVDLSGVPSEP